MHRTLVQFVQFQFCTSSSDLLFSVISWPKYVNYLTCCISMPSIVCFMAFSLIPHMCIIIPLVLLAIIFILNSFPLSFRESIIFCRSVSLLGISTYCVISIPYVDSSNRLPIDVFDCAEYLLGIQVKNIWG